GADGTRVEVLVFPAGLHQPEPVRPGPYAFADESEALAFLAEAEEALIDLRPGRTVLDLAAGTGKMTRLLLQTGADVVAVEPVAEMRLLLERAVPHVC